MESKKTERFSWIDDPSIVVRHYGSIALYRNEFGDLVIRQEKQSECQDEDFTIVVRSVDIPLLIKELQKKLEEP